MTLLTGLVEEATVEITGRSDGFSSFSLPHGLITPTCRYLGLVIGYRGYQGFQGYQGYR